MFLYREDLNLATATAAGTTTKASNDLQVSLINNNKNNNSTNTSGGRKQVAKRDERRRATHNEVERRRRDKINNWIMKLGSIIPDTCEAPSNNRHGGPVDGLSKGGILAAACEYIGELKEENENLTRHKLEVATLCETSQFLVDDNARLQQENQQLRAILQRHGIHIEVHPSATKEQEGEEGEPQVTVINALAS